MAGMLPGRAGGIVRNGGLWNRGIRGPGIRQNGGGAESRRKNTASRDGCPHGRAAGVGQRMQAGLPARQDGDDARPARVSGVDVYLPVQVGDDQAAEVEPEAVALAEGVEFGETLEDIAVLLGRDAAARVGDGDEDAVVAQTVAFEADRAFLRDL